MFSVYQENLELPLGATINEGDVDFLLKTFRTKRFANKIKIDKHDNQLIINAGADTIIANLTGKEFVEENSEKDATEQLTFDRGFDIDGTQAKSFVNNIEILTSKLDTPYILFTVKNKKLSVTTSDITRNITTEIPVEYKDCSVKINGKYFKKIVETLGNKFSISFDTDSPMMITEKTDKLYVVYIIAPVVGDDIQVEKSEESNKSK